MAEQSEAALKATLEPACIRCGAFLRETVPESGLCGDCTLPWGRCVHCGKPVAPAVMAYVECTNCLEPWDGSDAIEGEIPHIAPAVEVFDLRHPDRATLRRLRREAGAG